MGYRSEVLQRGVGRLITQTLEEKANLFRNRIEGVVETFTCSEQQKETGRLEQEDGREEQNATRSEMKSNTVSDITQLMPGTQHLYSNVNDIHMGRIEQKSRARTTESHRGGAVGRNEGQTIRKTYQTKPIVSKTTTSVTVGSKSPEIEQATVKKSTHSNPGTLKGNHGIYAGSAVQEKESSASGVNSQELVGAQIVGGPEMKDRKSDNREMLETVHIVERNFSFDVNTPQSGETGIDLHVERKLINNREPTVVGRTEPQANHSPRRLEKISIEENCTKNTNEPSMEIDSNEWSPDSTEESVGDPSNKDVHWTAPEIEEEDDGRPRTGDQSDVQSDISEVSSVHTSDLSSFDDEVSSVTDEDEEQNSHIDESDVDGVMEHIVEGDDQVNIQQEGLLRRSRRISSRRSTREDESEQNDMTREQAKSVTNYDTSGGDICEVQTSENQEGVMAKRKRGRPRKTERPPSYVGHVRTQQERERRSRRRHRIEKGDNDPSDVGKARKRSQRRIKRTRCYSPSSEGTREVHLPYKRSRISSKD